MEFLVSVGTVAAVISAIAAILVIPEVRRKVGLEKPENQSSKVVRVEHHYSGHYDEGVILNFKDNVGLGYYINNELIAYLRPYLTIDVVSLSDREWVKIAPYLVVRMLHRIRLPDDVNVYVDVRDGKGGGGDPDYFTALLTPDQKSVFFAPSRKRIRISSDEDDSSSEKEIATNAKWLDRYYELKPGEREVFVVEFVMYPGYFYEIQVGVLLTHKGKTWIEWIRQHFKMSSPTSYTPWTVKGVRRYNDSGLGDYPEDYLLTGFAPSKIKPVHYSMDNDVEDKFRRLKATHDCIIANMRAFRPPEIPDGSSRYREEQLRNMLKT